MKSIKALEIQTYMLFDLDFAKNIILSCFCFFFSITDLYFLISAAFAQIFNPVAEFVFPIGISGREAKAEIEKHPVNVEAKVFNII